MDTRLRRPTLPSACLSFYPDYSRRFEAAYYLNRSHGLPCGTFPDRIALIRVVRSMNSLDRQAMSSSTLSSKLILTVFVLAGAIVLACAAQPPAAAQRIARTA